MTASKSKWFVGSSNSRISGSTKRALANATLILQPPDNEPTVLLSMFGVKPRPPKIVAAFDSALLASIYSSLL